VSRTSKFIRQLHNDRNLDKGSNGNNSNTNNNNNNNGNSNDCNTNNNNSNNNNNNSNNNNTVYINNNNFNNDDYNNDEAYNDESPSSSWGCVNESLHGTPPLPDSNNNNNNNSWSSINLEILRLSQAERIVQQEFETSGNVPSSNSNKYTDDFSGQSSPPSLKLDLQSFCNHYSKYKKSLMDTIRVSAQSDDDDNCNNP
jgi:hypothetical protein